MRKVAIITSWGYDCTEEEAVFQSVHSDFNSAVLYAIKTITEGMELIPSFTVKGNNHGLEYTTISCGLDTETPVHFNIQENYLEE